MPKREPLTYYSDDAKNTSFMEELVRRVQQDGSVSVYVEDLDSDSAYITCARTKQEFGLSAHMLRKLRKNGDLLPASTHQWGKRCKYFYRRGDVRAHLVRVNQR